MLWLIDLISAGLLATAIGLTAANWADLPEKVPIHFGFRGEPDQWAPKIWIWLLPAVALFSWGTLWAVSRLADGPPAWFSAMLRLLTNALFLSILADQIAVAKELRAKLHPRTWVLIAAIIVVPFLMMPWLGR